MPEPTEHPIVCEIGSVTFVEFPEPVKMVRIESFGHKSKVRVIGKKAEPINREMRIKARAKRLIDRGNGKKRE